MLTTPTPKISIDSLEVIEIPRSAVQQKSASGAAAREKTTGEIDTLAVTGVPALASRTDGARIRGISDLRVAEADVGEPLVGDFGDQTAGRLNEPHPKYGWHAYTQYLNAKKNSPTVRKAWLIWFLKLMRRGAQPRLQ